MARGGKWPEGVNGPRGVLQEPGLGALPTKRMIAANRLSVNKPIWLYSSRRNTNWERRGRLD